MGTLSITWTLRSDPLPPVGVIARGAAALALAHRLMERTDEQLALLAGVQCAGLLVVLSDDPALLPWSDGAVYLGRDPSVPSLLIATTYVPFVPLPLLENAIRHRFPDSGTPLVVLPNEDTIVPLKDCRRPIVRTTLQQWIVGRS